MTKEIKLRRKVWGCGARLFVQNFDAVLVVIVISAGDAIFAKFHNKLLKHKVTHFDLYSMLFFLGGDFLEVCRRQRRARAGARPWARGQTWAHMETLNCYYTDTQLLYIHIACCTCVSHVMLVCVI